MSCPAHAMMESEVIDIVPSADSLLEKLHDVQSPTKTSPSQLTAQSVMPAQPGLYTYAYSHYSG